MITLLSGCREKLAVENTTDYGQLLEAHASSTTAEPSAETLTLLLTFDGYLLDESSSLSRQLDAYGYRQVTLTAVDGNVCLSFVTMLRSGCRGGRRRT